MLHISQRLIISRLALALFVAGVASGCENPVDDTPNKFPTIDAGSDIALPTDTTNTTGPSCDCLKVGDWYRFDTLKLTSIDGDPKQLVIGTLNNLWKADIAALELNFFAQIKSVKSDLVEVYIVNGARVGTAGSTCLLDYTGATVTFPRNGCKLLSSLPASMNVYAGTEVNTKNCAPTMAAPYGVKHAIPVREAVLLGEFAIDCSVLSGGRVVQGSFSKVALEKTCTCLTTPGQPAETCGVPDGKYIDVADDGKCNGCNDSYKSLSVLLEAFSDNGLNYTCKDVAGGKAVCLEAEFSAKKVSADKIGTMTGSCKP